MTALNRKILMPHVNPVKAARQAEIRAVIHDEHRSAADHTPQFTAMANHLCCCGPLISVLNEGGSASEQLLRELNCLLQRIFSIFKHGSVNDRVQRRKFVMLRNHYSALGPAEFENLRGPCVKPRISEALNGSVIGGCINKCPNFQTPGLKPNTF